MDWESVIAGGVSALGSFFGKKDEAKRNFKYDKKLLEIEIQGRKELQDDQQAFEQFLIDRRNVAGGRAYGGPATVADFWGGQNDPTVAKGISDFFSNIGQRENSFSAPSSIAPDVSKFSAAGKIDPQVGVQGQAREEYQKPLSGLLSFLRGGGNQGSGLLRTAYKPDDGG